VISMVKVTTAPPPPPPPPETWWEKIIAWWNSLPTWQKIALVSSLTFGTVGIALAVKRR